MTETHSPRRFGYGRDSSGRRPPHDREQIAQARQAAEALFAPKPQTRRSANRPRIAAGEAIGTTPPHLEIEPAGQSAGHVTDQSKSAPNIRRSPSRYLRGSTPGAVGGGARYGGRHAESKPLEREPGHIP